MAKLMLSLFVFILISASAQSDDTLKSYNEETPFTFSAKYPSTTLLAYWTSDRNANFNIEFEGIWIRKHYYPYRSTRLFYYSKGSNAWHFINIIMGNSELQINSNGKRYPVQRSKDDIRMKIKSKGRIYWQRCTDHYSCDLPGPESNATECITDSTPQSNKGSTMDLTTLLLLGACCLSVVIVVGLVVYIIILKKSTLNEPRANTSQDNFYDEVQLSKNFGNSPREGMVHETINSLYGGVIPSEERQ